LAIAEQRLTDLKKRPIGDTVGDILAVTPFPIGTEHSFLQMRVGAGGYLVLSDLVIEYQGDGNNYVDYPPCVVDAEFFMKPPPPTVQGIPFTGLPLNIDFGVGREEFFAHGERMGTFLALSNDPDRPFYDVLSSAVRIHINDQDRIRFGNAYWVAGMKALGTTTSVDQPNGDMDLSAPFRITMEITDLPAPDGTFQVYLDNNTTGAANSIHGNASRLLNLSSLGGLAIGTLVIEVPGEITMNGTPVGATVAQGTANSFLSFRCPANCGDANSGEEGGIEIASIEIEYTGSAPGSSSSAGGSSSDSSSSSAGSDDAWISAGFTLYGTPAKPPSGTITLNEPDAVTLTSTGGHVSNGAHAFYFAYQEIDTGNFSFSARIASVAGMSIGTGTTYRFGLMARQGLNAGEMLNDLDAWAEIGFYANTEAVLVGSHARLKSMSNGGGVSRANIFDLEVGHWVRMDIFDDGEQKRIAHLYSIDGVNWTQLSSTTDFAAYSNSSYWLVGLFAAVGQNHVAVEFDSITIEPL
jgi:hypothetical protein